MTVPKWVYKVLLWIATFLAGAVTVYLIQTKTKQKAIEEKTSNITVGDIVSTSDDIEELAAQKRIDAYEEVFNETKQAVVNRFLANFSTRPGVDG